MNWVLPAILAVATLHILAIVAGRSTSTLPHRIAFASGILGLLSIPAVFVAGLLSLCIAGGCADGFSSADFFGIAFLVIASSSLISLAVIAVRRPRA